MNKLPLMLALTLSMNGCLTMAVGTVCAVGSAWGGDSCSGEISDKVFEAAWDLDGRIIDAVIPDEDSEYVDSPWVPVSLHGVVTAGGVPVPGARAELISILGTVALVQTDSVGGYKVPEVRIQARECAGLMLIVDHPDERPVETLSVECRAQRLDHEFFG